MTDRQTADDSPSAKRFGRKERIVTVALATFAVAAPVVVAAVAVLRLNAEVDPAIALGALGMCLLGPFLAAIVVALRGMGTINSAFAARKDSEPQQAIIRVFFTGVVLLYLAALAGLGLGGKLLLPLLAVDVPGILCSWLLFVHLMAYPAASAPRRYAAMASDVVFISVFLHVGDLYAAPWFSIYLWVVFGFGFRYGLKELAVSAILSILGFGVVVASTPFWQERAAESAGVYVALALLPSYAATLVRRLHNARAVAEEAAAGKSRFLAVMSHELRTPLNSFIGMGALFARTNLDAEQRDMLSTMRLSAQTLLGLINDLLDLSKLEAGKVNPVVESFVLHEVMGGVVALMKPQAEAKNLALTLSLDPRLPQAYRGLPQQLRQVLINLVANAIKFTPRGRISLAAVLLSRTGDSAHLALAVKDDGVGIPPEAQSRIFEVFTQADESVARRFGGTGLGLAISKQLVDLMGGNIAVSSQPGQGATFTVTIDLDVDAAAKAPSPDLSTRTLALISPDSDFAAMVQGRIRAWRGELKWYAEGEAALAELARDQGGRQILALLDGRDNPMAALSVAHRLATSADEPPLILFIAAEKGSEAVAGIGATQLAAVIEAPMGEDKLASALLSVIAADPRQGAVSAASQPASVAAEPAALTNTAPPPAPIMPATKAALPPTQLRALKILVADDNAANCKILKKMLEVAGHQAVVVGDGEAALAALERERFDLALLDINMPDVTGYEVAKLYRMSHVGEWRLPIVALTADVTSETERLCREAGMDAVLTKPMEPVQLLAALGEIHAKAEGAGERRILVAPRVVTPISAHPRFVSDAGSVVDEDTFVALKNLGGAEFVVEVVDTFRKDARRLLDHLRKAVEKADLRDFRDVTHSLRSGAANVGGVRLCETLTAMRELTATDLTQTGPAYLDKIVGEFSRIETSLEQMTRAVRQG